MSYDSRPETWAHIHEVQKCMGRVVKHLLTRAQRHDQSKLEEPELSVFDQYTPLLKNSTYGSDEYKSFLAGMGEGLRHHYAHNDHHPEYFEDGIDGMDLLQVVEMLCDWKAATLRHDDGDLARSIEQNAARFGYGDEIRGLLLNTARKLHWIEEPKS